MYTLNKHIFKGFLFKLYKMSIKESTGNLLNVHLLWTM